MIMNRKEILGSPEYWIAKAQIDLYNCAENFMEFNNMNRTQLAKYLGVSKGYVSQLLNGDYDHKLSKLAELSIAFGFVPKIEFQPIDEVVNEDQNEYKLPDWKQNIKYICGYTSGTKQINMEEDYESNPNKLNTFAA